MPFQSLGLSSKELLHNIKTLGYTSPTPIQNQAIPVILTGQDVLALAKTGTGKTAGFALPLLQKLSNDNERKDKKSGHRFIRALIMVPTRELTTQVAEKIKEYSQRLQLRSEVIFGGVSIRAQISKLQKGVDIVVGTPGRLIDLINRKAINLSKIENLVLDEADRMLDMGFITDIKKIISVLPKQLQTMLFSATLSKEIKSLSEKLLKDPEFIQVTNKNTVPDLVSQEFHPVDQGRKGELLSSIISSNNWQQVLVFTRTKRGADNLCKQLISDGLPAVAIHGDKNQNLRNKALRDFKLGKARVLVATDVVARGIDIANLQYVVNFEIPNAPEDYVHRIGRTGRAGKKGVAVSLVANSELKTLKNIEAFIKQEITKKIISGFEPTKVKRRNNKKRNSKNLDNKKKYKRNSKNLDNKKKYNSKKQTKKPSRGKHKTID